VCRKIHYDRNFRGPKRHLEMTTGPVYSDEWQIDLDTGKIDPRKNSKLSEWGGGSSGNWNMRRQGRENTKTFTPGTSIEGKASGRHWKNPHILGITRRGWITAAAPGTRENVPFTWFKTHFGVKRQTRIRGTRVGKNERSSTRDDC